MKGIFEKDIGGDVLMLNGLSIAPDGVEKDADGKIKAFRVFKFGPLSATKNGEDLDLLSGEFLPEHAAAIAAFYDKKNEKIPIDCNHMLALVAEAAGKTEAEIVALTGDKHLAAGFAKLEQRADGLWAVDADWVPLGAELLKQKVMRHYSPVIRGLKAGPLRITSVTLTNTPAIDNQDAIAASAISPATESPVVAQVKTLFGLQAAAPDAAVLGAVSGIAEKLKLFDTMKAQVDALQLSAENSKRDALVEQGLKAGKLSNAMLSWAKEQNSVALSAFLNVAPQTVPVDGLPPGAQNDSVALSAEDIKIFQNLGLTSAQIENLKKGTK